MSDRVHRCVHCVSSRVGPSFPKQTSCHVIARSRKARAPAYLPPSISELLERASSLCWYSPPFVLRDALIARSCDTRLTVLDASLQQTSKMEEPSPPNTVMNDDRASQHGASLPRPPTSTPTLERSLKASVSHDQDSVYPKVVDEDSLT